MPSVPLSPRTQCEVAREVRTHSVFLRWRRDRLRQQSRRLRQQPQALIAAGGATPPLPLLLAPFPRAPVFRGSCCCPAPRRTGSRRSRRPAVRHCTVPACSWNTCARRGCLVCWALPSRGRWPGAPVTRAGACAGFAANLQRLCRPISGCGPPGGLCFVRSGVRSACGQAWRAMPLHMGLHRNTERVPDETGFHCHWRHLSGECPPRGGVHRTCRSY
jgi:hypothetical protein